MVPPPTRSLRLVTLAALLAVGLLLAACGGAGGGGGTTPAPTDPDASPSTVDTAFGNASDGISAAVADIGSDAATEALNALPPLTLQPSVMTLLRDPALAFDRLERGLETMQDAVATLPRGHWVYGASGWTRVADIDELRLEWPVATAGGGTTTATAEIDWDDPGATVVATSPYDGGQTEVPRDASGSLTVGTTRAASADLAVDWADGAPCSVSGPVQAIPDGATLDASFGVGSVVDIDEATYAISSSDIRTSGRVTATTPSSSGEVSWNVVVTAPGSRDATSCEPEFGTATAIAVDVSISSTYAGTSESFRFVITVDDFVYDSDGALEAFDVEGRLELNGSTAVSFVGTLDETDSDGDGVIGENVILTYGNGFTETLEAFLERSSAIGSPALPLRALGTLLR